jgi:acyl carrier protein
MSKTYEMIAEGLVAHLGLDPDKVRPEATFADLGVGSLDMIELALVLEDEHGINTDGIDPAGTLAQAAAYLEQAAKAAGPVPTGGQQPADDTP